MLHITSCVWQRRRRFYVDAQTYVVCMSICMCVNVRVHVCLVLAGRNLLVGHEI